MPELICKILHISKTTYYSYLKKNYPIINFLLSFKKEELIELLETGKIQKQELIKDLSLDDLTNLNKLKEQLILDEIKRKEIEIKELKAQLNMQ